MKQHKRKLERLQQELPGGDDGVIIEYVKNWRDTAGEKREVVARVLVTPGGLQILEGQAPWIDAAR